MEVSEEKRKRQKEERSENRAVSVELSYTDLSPKATGYEDIKNRVEKIRLLLQKEDYKVSPEKNQIAFKSSCV